MTKDVVDFVRQGAFIALGMILVEQPDTSSSAITSIRSTYSKVISNKHEDPMARFGAVLGQGLIDAGGRNVTISLQSRAGSRNTNAIVGMVLFCQFWYWYPLAHCISLAFEPTGIIGLDANLRVRLTFECHGSLINLFFSRLRSSNSFQMRSPVYSPILHPRSRLRRRQ